MSFYDYLANLELVVNFIVFQFGRMIIFLLGNYIFLTIIGLGLFSIVVYFVVNLIFFNDVENDKVAIVGNDYIIIKPKRRKII